eukprot:938715-Amphidinium_carterae.1
MTSSSQSDRWVPTYWIFTKWNIKSYKKHCKTADFGTSSSLQACRGAVGFLFNICSSSYMLPIPFKSLYKVKGNTFHSLTPSFRN